MILLDSPRTSSLACASNADMTQISESDSRLFETWKNMVHSGQTDVKTPISKDIG